MGSGYASEGLSHVGAIVIRSGVVIASSGVKSAGIGSSFGDIGTSSVGRISIEGGGIASTADDGAGIGAGCGNSTVTNLTIKSGQVVAQGNQGSGIGAGLGRHGLSYVHNIEIDGGDVRASSVICSAGIGGGCAYEGNSSVGMIRIRGGAVRSVGHDGAGIGSGYCGGGASRLDGITIEGGIVTALSESYGAGIGGGYEHRQGISTVTSLTILNGTVTATGTDGAGIGAGYGDHGSSYVGALKIAGAHITAVGMNGAGISAGYGKTATGRSIVSTLRIDSGVIFASATNAPGIGFGYSPDGVSDVQELTIVQGNITTRGSSGIAAGQLILGSGSNVRIIRIECTPTEGPCLAGDNLTITNAVIVASTASSTFLAPFSIHQMLIADLVGHYLVKSDIDQSANITAIHIGSIEWSQEQLSGLTFRTEGYTRTIQVLLGVVKGVIISVAHTGTFVIEIDGQELCHDNISQFAIVNGVNFFPKISVCITPDAEGAFHISMQAIVGISVGAAAVLIAVVIVVISIRRRKRNTSQKVGTRDVMRLESASGAGIYTPSNPIV
jgi:hypothetical protein